MTVLTFATAASACATDRVTYEARPIGEGVYAVSLSGPGTDEDEQRAALEKRAVATCGGAYQLTDKSVRLAVCADNCNNRLTTIATLACEKKSA